MSEIKELSYAHVSDNEYVTISKVRDELKYVVSSRRSKEGSDEFELDSVLIDHRQAMFLKVVLNEIL